MGTLGSISGATPGIRKWGGGIGENWRGTHYIPFPPLPTASPLPVSHLAPLPFSPFPSPLPLPFPSPFLFPFRGAPPLPKHS